MRNRFFVLGFVLAALGCGNSSSTCPQDLCNGVCCADGEQCIANGCCPAAQICEGACCASGTACVGNTSTGTRSCETLCLKSGDCPSAIPCCSPVPGSAQGVCTNASSSCLCLSSLECDGGECVPDINTGGLIAGPYVCVANDGSSHDGCGGGSCQVTTRTCAADLLGNQFCSVSCTSDLNCGNAGVACCNATCASNTGFGETLGHCCGLCGH